MISSDLILQQENDREHTKLLKNYLKAREDQGAPNVMDFAPCQVEPILSLKPIGKN